MKIREAVARDYDALCALIDQGDALHRENVPNVFRKPRGPIRETDFIQGLIGSNDAALFVAEIEDNCAGFVAVMIHEAPDIPIFLPRRYAVIDNIVVARGFRLRGVGRALMEKAWDWSLLKGVDSIELNVWDFNVEAIGFYRRLGYETVSRKMRKRLPGKQECVD